MTSTDRRRAVRRRPQPPSPHPRGEWRPRQRAGRSPDRLRRDTAALLMRRAPVLFLAIAITLLAAAPASADISDTAVKAAFIPKFARYVPGRPELRREPPVRWCCASSATIRSAPRSTRPRSSQSVDGRPFVIKLSLRRRVLGDCAIAIHRRPHAGETLSALGPPADPHRHRRAQQLRARHDPFRDRRRPSPLLHRQCPGPGARPHDQLAAARARDRGEPAARMFRNPLPRWRPLPPRSSSSPSLILAAGFAIILQNEVTFRANRDRQAQVAAQVLAGSVTAALDFDDPAASQQAVDAFRSTAGPLRRRLRRSRPGARRL